MELKIVFLVILASASNVLAAPGYAQDARVSLDMENAKLEKVMDEIEKQSEFYFIFNQKQIDVNRVVDIYAENKLISDILPELFKGSNVKYALLDRKILLTSDLINNNPKINEAKLAPPKVVTGKVMDSKGETLPGVNVSLKGTLIGVSTNMEGKYSIEVPEGFNILVFSFIGFTFQEIAISDRLVIDVNLQEESKGLSEVVVTALGISRTTKSLTYSTQGVNTDDMKKAAEPNVMMSLQGKVAGLSINSSGTGLGADARVTLRGNRSISGDSQPLYVIDGVPIRGNPSNLSLDNIASINILKGPNAAALYGSAAQNGAIIIETKNGQGNGVNISLNNTYMVLDPVLSIPFQNVYGQGLGGVYGKTSEFAWGPKMEGQMVDNWSQDPAMAGTQYAFSPQPNNKRGVYNQGSNFASSLFASIGGEKTQTAFTYTYTKAKGILPNNELKRHNLSLRVNNKFSKKLSMDSKIDYINQTINNRLAEGESNFNPNRQIYTMAPNLILDDVRKYQYTDQIGMLKQNYWNRTTTNGLNPFWILNNNPNELLLERVIAMTSFTYSFTDALKFMVRGSYDGASGSSEERLYNDTYVRAPDGRYSKGKSNAYLLNGDFLVSYKKDLNKDFTTSTSVGGSIQKKRDDAISSTTGASMIIPNFFTLSNTNLPVTTNSVGLSSDIQSLYAFTNIGWKNAVFLDLTGRNDWSSTLPASSRSYFYPSVGLSAVLSDLIPSFPKSISFAKFRASWASVGNSAPPYMLERTATFKAGGRYGFLQFSSILLNPNLLPEKTLSTELGLTVKVFQGRLGMDVTVYKTNTLNQLFSIALPVGSGAAQYFTNGGNVQNKGIELLLTGSPVKNTAMIWDVSVNYAVNRNMVLEISDERPSIVIGNDPYVREFRIEQGRPYGEIYSKGWLRDDQGRVIVGANGVPKITPGRTVLIANFNPDWTGGLTNTFSYKNFNLSFLIEHRQGGSIVSMTKAILDGAGLTKRTLDGRDGGLIFGKNIFMNEIAVKADGTPNDIAMKAETFWLGVGGRNTPVGEAFVSSATNTRFRELSLGYTLTGNMLGRLPVRNLTLSLVGRNLFYINRVSPDLDTDLMAGTTPDSEGFQSFAPPTTRSFGFNLKVDFK